MTKTTCSSSLFPFLATLALGGLVPAGADPVSGEVVTLPELYVTASHTATVEPASTYGAPVSRLELNPQIDLQVRGLAEAQGDVTVRGGIFENTGFRVGAATLLDPQTGHYFAEIPIAPEMLQGPELLVGVDNALGGFNSTVGTVAFGWSQISEGGSLAFGFGDHDLNYQRLRQGHLLGGRGAGSWGAELEVSRSESDGTIENGDHDFARFSGRLQRQTENSQTDFFAGYQSKFLAWPELYAAPYGSNESDSVRTTLLLVNHRQSYAEGSEWEATAYHRRHHDHYLFNRFVDSPAFLHQTEVSSVALAGRHQVSERFAWRVAGQVTADEIESSNLENHFTSRSYAKLSVLPEFALRRDGEDRLLLRAGASFDDSNRDASKVSPMAELAWERGGDRYYLSFAQATQVAGYTAVGGSPSGLFAGNPDLNREVSRNLEAGVTLQRGEWSLRAAAFSREDADLVDWTFSYDATSARSASNVDIDTYGLETIVSRRFGSLELLGSLTVLDKDEDYGSAAVDASFYALNYAKRRVTLAAVWTPSKRVQVRVDNEYRAQRENALREGGDHAFFTHLGVSYFIPEWGGLELNAAVENLWREDFEEIPGTPGRGRQLSAGARWRW